MMMMGGIRHCYGVFVILLAASLLGVTSAADCNFTSCADCTRTSGCGWCSATQSCLSGSSAGPEEGGAYCLGSWHTTCIDCTSKTTCSACSANLDCQWCKTSSGTNKCSVLGDATQCASKQPCACSEYNTCHECSQQAGCSFCSTGTCSESSNQACTHVSCACQNYPTCTTCSNDAACGWCYEHGVCSSFPANCNITSCDAHCNKFQSCLTCTEARGCGWCPDKGGCHSIDSTICPKLHMQCNKNCSTLPDCNSCVDMGLPCEWCLESKSCIDISFKPECSTIDNCAAEVCAEAEDCDICLQTPGCGWCGKGNGHCIDIFDAGDCALAHSCSESLREEFSVGSFFGGMATMLVVYLVIGVAAYLYKKRNPPIHYEPVNEGSSGQ